MGGYFGTPFKGYSGVIHGDPLSSTVFNVVVNVVLRNWILVVTEAEGEVVPEGFGRDIKYLADHFYADYGLLSSERAVRQKMAFSVLTEIFDQFGLHQNVRKMVGMD